MWAAPAAPGVVSVQQSARCDTSVLSVTRGAGLAMPAGHMVSPARGQRAQQYARGYWASLASRIAAGSESQLDWYRWCAEQLVERLRTIGLGQLTDGSARVVEVRSGPIGVVGFFPAAERVAIDPLESYYAAQSTLVALRNPAVDYRAG